MASLDFKTAFVMAKTICGVSIFTLDGGTRTLCGSSLDEMKDVRGSACFQDCEMEFRYSRCIGREGLRAQCCGEELPNTSW